MAVYIPYKALMLNSTNILLQKWKLTGNKPPEHKFNTDNEAFICAFHYFCIPNHILLSMWRVLTAHTHTHTHQGIACVKVNQLVLNCSVMKRKPSSLQPALINTRWIPNRLTSTKHTRSEISCLRFFSFCPLHTHF